MCSDDIKSNKSQIYIEYTMYYTTEYTLCIIREFYFFARSKVCDNLIIKCDN